MPCDTSLSFKCKVLARLPEIMFLIELQCYASTAHDAAFSSHNGILAGSASLIIAPTSALSSSQRTCVRLMASDDLEATVNPLYISSWQQDSFQLILLLNI